MKISSLLKQFRRGELIGIDIGSRGVKLVRLVRGGGDQEQTSKWFYKGSLLRGDKGEISSFRDFLAENQLNGSAVTTNIEDPSLKIRKVELPKMPDFDLREAVRWQMRDIVDGKIDDYIVRYSHLEEFDVGETKKLSLIVYAVRKEAIESHCRLLKELTLNPVVVEPNSVSLLAAFDFLRGWQEGKYYGLIDFGESKSVFTAMGEGKLYFSRPLIGVSGEHLLGILRKELNLPSESAERLKEDLMGIPLLDKSLLNFKTKAEDLLPVLQTQLLVETQRSIDAFSIMFRREKISHLFLTGGGSFIPGLCESLKENLGIPTSLLKPLKKSRISSEEMNIYHLALGLALHPG